MVWIVKKIKINKEWSIQEILNGTRRRIDRILYSVSSYQNSVPGVVTKQNAHLVFLNGHPSGALDCDLSDIETLWHCFGAQSKVESLSICMSPPDISQLNWYNMYYVFWVTLSRCYRELYTRRYGIRDSMRIYLIDAFTGEIKLW